MKKLTRLIVLALCVSLTLAGCKGAPAPAEKERPYLIRDGKSYFRIVLPANPTELEKLAADELKHFFQTATGVTLKVISDEDTVYSPKARLIVLGGGNKMAKAAGMSVSEGATSESGFTLRQKDDSVFILGRGDFGTLYGVYEFLEQVFHYEIFAETEIKIDKNVTDRQLPALDVTDTPDIPFRQANTGVLQENELLMRRFRANSYADVMLWGDGTGLFVHNFQIWVPKNLMGEHPLWFSENSNPAYAGEQLCLSRDREGLSAFVIDRMIEEMENHPQLRYMTFTQTDAADWCQCEACGKAKQKYGTDAAVYVQFTNILAKAVRAHFSAAGDPRDIQIGIFAYQKTEPAPVKEVDGRYVAIDESVIPEDNVFIFIAPGEADYFRPLNDPLNSIYFDNVFKWTSITDSVFMWTYKHFVMDYLTPFYSFRSMQENYKLCRDINTVYLFDQGQHNQNVVTDWAPLKNYLEMNLMWDVDADAEALTDRFFANYYKQAAAPMRRLFESYRLFMEYQLANDEGIVGVCYPGTSAWTADIPIMRETLTGWLAYIDEALAAIDSLRASNPTLFTELESRILLESVTYRHILIQKFGSTYGNAELREMCESLQRDIVRLGIRQYSSERTVDVLFDEMRAMWA